MLSLLTVVPGPGMAVVTKRAIALGRAEGLRTAADRTKALAENQIAAMWRLAVGLREKTLCKMLRIRSQGR